MTAPSVGPRNAGVVEVDGARLPYRIEGHGQPCLVLGSIAVSARSFSPTLREHLELVFVDLRHFAPSDPTFTADQITIDTYLDDIERVRKALGLGKAVVIGHSAHSAIALEYAGRYAGHVRGVVVIGGAPYESEDDYRTAFDALWLQAPEDRRVLHDQRQAELTPELQASLAPAEMFVRQYLALGPSWWYDPTYDAAWLWEGVNLNWPVFERYGSLFDTYVPGHGPGQITVPVLIAHGRHDYQNPYTLWEKHRHALPHHTFALFDRSGHAPQLEEAEAFDARLLAWVDALADAERRDISRR